MGTRFGGGQIKSRAIAQHVVEPISDIVAQSAHASGSELERSVLGEVLRGAPVAMLIVDTLDRICFSNDAASALLGHSADELRLGFLQNYLTLPYRLDDGSSAGLRCVAWSPAAVFAVTLGDGRAAQAKFTAVRDRFGKVTYISVALEPIAAQPEGAMLELLGRLSGELAHDINNHLSAALNYVFILRRRLAVQPVTDHLEELQAAIWRASGLASTLKILGAKRGAQPDQLQVSATMRALEPLLRHLARDVRVQMRLARDLPGITAQRSYFEQVMITLALLLLARAPTDSVLRVTAHTAPPSANTGCTVRVTMELVADGERTNTRRSANGHPTHSGLRRALKRCGARLGHDARRVWVEFK